MFGSAFAAVILAHKLRHSLIIGRRTQDQLQQAKPSAESALFTRSVQFLSYFVQT